MNKWNLIIDVAECTNCNNCLLAAKDELVDNDFPGYSRPHPAQGTGVIRIERTVRGVAPMVDAAYLPRLCNHCDDAPCLRASGASGAVVKRADGIVLIDPVKAKGRRDLVEACPYGAVIWNEAEQLPQHWFFDAHLLDQGATAPRCVAVCPTQAITAVQLDDAAMAARAAADGLRVLAPALGTRPRVYYRHLERIDSVFVGGSVTTSDGADCVEDAAVSLWRDGAVIAQARTDGFGDFRFDGLSKDFGPCQITVQHERHGHARCEAVLAQQSIVLGDIALAPALAPA